MKNKIIKTMVMLSLGIFLYSCDAKRNALYQEISQLESDVNFITTSLASNHKEQLNLFKQIYQKGFFNQVSGGAFANYYVGSIVKGFDEILFDEAKLIKPNKNYVADMIVHLSNLYDGNEPYKYAYITMYNSIDWQLKIFRVLKNGSIVSLNDKCDKAECQTYYVYIEGLKGVDNQNFKQEFVLEYLGSFAHNEPQIELTTIPSFKILRKIKYSTPNLLTKWVAYNESLKTLDNEIQYIKVAKKSKKLTYAYLDDKDKIIDPDNYDMEVSKKYLTTYGSMVESLYNYRKTRRDYYSAYHPQLYKALLKDPVFADYPKLYKNNKAKIEELQKKYNDLLNKLQDTNKKIAYLKEQAK
jgi:hypothetical protein